MQHKKYLKFFNYVLAIILTLSLFNPAFTQALHETKKHDTEKITMLQEIVTEQDALLERKGDIHPKLKQMQRSSAQEMSVIVQLSKEPISLTIGKQKLKGQSVMMADQQMLERQITTEQNRFLNRLDAENIFYKKGNVFHRTINAMELTVSAEDIEKLASLPEVVSVDPNEEMYALESPSEEIKPHMGVSAPHLDVPDVWEQGIDGEGVKVGVIDTGIDYDHPDLKDAYAGGKNFVDHEEDVYVRDRDDDDPYETSPKDRAEGVPEVDPETGSSFYTSHGTHVAGTIAAAGVNDYDIKGLAPGVEIHAYRVLGAYGTGNTDWVIAGIEQSVKDGMDVINLSLGGGSNSEKDPTAFAVNNATLEGVTVVSATGNTGPSEGSIGSPATSPLGIAVGNSTLPETMLQADVSVEAGEYEKESTISLLAWTFGSSPEETLEGEFDLIPIPNWGEPDDYEDLDVEGKVVLISRGETPFVDKIEAARDAGAIATIIHNHEGEGPADVYLGDTFDWIPSFDMATEEGEALREALDDAGHGVVSFSNFTSSEIEGNEINETSSQGPSTPNHDIKPDVVAPGTNIMSTVPAYLKDFEDASFEKAYDRSTGTSMASPHVAGAAALLLEANPNWDPYDVKIALSNSAKLLDTETYHVFAQGAGLIQPKKALSNDIMAYTKEESVAYEDEGEEEKVTHKKGTITFGRVAPDAESTKEITKEIEIRHLSGGSTALDVDIEQTVTGQGANISVDQSQIQVDGGATLEVTLEIEPGEDIPGNEYRGYIHLTNSETNIELPYAVELSEEELFGLEEFTLLDDVISPEDEEKVHSTELHFKILHDEELMSIELFDLEDPEGGEFEDGSIGLLASQPLASGAYRLEIDGTYIDWEDYLTEKNEDKPIPDGAYMIDYYSWDLATEDTELLGVEGPFFVKRTDPSIQVDDTEVTVGEEVLVSGEIDDAFVDYQDTVETILEEEYDVNEYLTVMYEVVDEDGETIQEETVTLEEDGSFSESLGELEIGSYDVIIFAEDLAKNASEHEATVTVKELEDIDITLTPTTTEESEEVTIDVDVDSSSNIATAKWLLGEHDIDAFAESGEAIDLTEMSFTVRENGVYTVYIQNEDGVESVQTITIENIVKGQERDKGQKRESNTDDKNGDLVVDGEMSEKEDADGREIPKTATPWYNFLFIGLFFIGAGAIIVYTRWRVKKIS